MKLKKFSFAIIQMLKDHVNQNCEHCYFPYCGIIESPFQLGYSRLAWCYGDLGIGIILYQAAKTFNDVELENFALEVLLHTTTRKEIEQTQAFDAGYAMVRQVSTYL